MLKVLIADDEKKVCRLIQMLCDWEKLDMELVGIAYNGIQALEMLEERKPDILITDICMPGCDGIEIIQKARERAASLEVLIISGYADFKYAQSAIHYGVSEYLLKPIKQQELMDTLAKLGARCRQEKARMDASHQLLQYVEDDNMRRRCQIFFDLLLSTPRRPVPDLETLNEQFRYRFVPGVFRILVLKLDYRPGKYDEKAVRSIITGLEEKLRLALTQCCEELELCIDGDMCYIICNYKDENGHLFRPAVRHAVEQINAKRFQLWEARFSLGMGRAVNDCCRLYESMEDALEALKERLLEGCEKLLEPQSTNGQVNRSQIIEDFNNESAKALELLDEQMAAAAVTKLKDTLLAEQFVTGADLIYVVNTAGIHAITKLGKQSSSDQITAFLSACEYCSSAEQLFDVLQQKLVQLIDDRKQQSEEEGRKPVRLAKQYIMNHYMEPVTLELVADKVGFSSSYFSSLFKKEAGIGFGEYLMQIRMEKAKALLKGSKTNVKDICTEVGYNDLKHFTATFRKYTGLKPGEYRKLYG